MPKKLDEDTIIIYGANWCADCHRSLKLLNSLKINYSYFDIDKDDGALDKMLVMTAGKKIIPTIIIGDTMLQEPSDQKLKTVLISEGVYNGHSNT